MNYFDNSVIKVNYNYYLRSVLVNPILMKAPKSWPKPEDSILPVWISCDAQMRSTRDSIDFKANFWLSSDGWFYIIKRNILAENGKVCKAFHSLCCLHNFTFMWICSTTKKVSEIGFSLAQTHIKVNVRKESISFSCHFLSTKR